MEPVVRFTWSALVERNLTTKPIHLRTGQRRDPLLGISRKPAWNRKRSANGGNELWSTGGGYSTLYPKPSWQTGNTNPFRGVPDVSLSAAEHDAYRACFSTAQCVINSYSTDYGTSIAAPAFAGIMALVVQRMGRQGNPLPALYSLAARTDVTAFHDITSGNNSVPGQTGYEATIGWDPVTGLGSVDAAALVNGWMRRSRHGCSRDDDQSSKWGGGQYWRDPR